MSPVKVHDRVDSAGEIYYFNAMSMVRSPWPRRRSVCRKPSNAYILLAVTCLRTTLRNLPPTPTRPSYFLKLARQLSSQQTGAKAAWSQRTRVLRGRARFWISCARRCAGRRRRMDDVGEMFHRSVQKHERKMFHRSVQKHEREMLHRSVQKHDNNKTDTNSKFIDQYKQPESRSRSCCIFTRKTQTVSKRDYQSAESSQMHSNSRRAQRQSARLFHGCRLRRPNHQSLQPNSGHGRQSVDKHIGPRSVG
jgi:hypothetical protein